MLRGRERWLGYGWIRTCENGGEPREERKPSVRVVDPAGTAGGAVEPPAVPPADVRGTGCLWIGANGSEEAALGRVRPGAGRGPPGANGPEPTFRFAGQREAGSCGAIGCCRVWAGWSEVNGGAAPVRASRRC